MKIRWTKSDGGENWASINGYVGDRLRFHIVGERIGGKVNGWDVNMFGPEKPAFPFAPRETLRQAKNFAQQIIDREQVKADLERARA